MTEPKKNVYMTLFLYVWNSVDKFNPNKYSLKNWLCLIARGRAHNRLNKLIKIKKCLRRLMDQRSAKTFNSLGCDRFKKKTINHFYF